MGFKDVGWAYKLELPTAQKVVLAAIAHATDDKTHQTYVSQKTVAGMVSMAVSTVNRSVGILEGLGILTRERRTGQGGFRTSDVITINTTYMPQTNVGETHIGETNMRDSGNLHAPQASPTSQSRIAEEINQKDQPEDQPVLIPEATFDDFWAIWPRKDDKKSAIAAWLRAVKRKSADEILATATEYANHPHRPAKNLVKYAATWLNGDCWDNPMPEAPGAQRAYAKPTPTDRARAILSLVLDEPEPRKELSR